MKRLPLLYITTAILLIAIAACTKNNTEVTDPSKVTLNNCSKAIANTSAYICFDSVISESRCPIGVVCIWAGYAMIKTSFHENGNTHSFRMMIPYINGLGAVNDTTINGYRIVFKDLSPYPDMTKPSPVSAIPTAIIEISK